MKPTSRKNRELISQYPFLEELLARTAYHPLWQPGNRPFDDLSIKVEVADGNLMYAQADNVGLNGNSWLWSTGDGSKKGQVGRRGEWLFAVDKENRIINRLDWPADGSASKVYGRLVLWGTRLGDGYYTDALWDQTQYLAWVRIDCWHEDLKDNEGRFGAVKQRSMHITIYRKPEKGFEHLHQHASMEEHLYLSQKVLIQAALDNDYQLIKISGQLDEICHTFQEEVYYNGLRDIADDPDYRICGSGQFGPTKVLVAELCGYERIMLEDNQCWVSFQIRPGSHFMYVLGVGGRLPQIRRLVKTVVDMWNRQPECHANFTHDRKVSVM